MTGRDQADIPAPRSALSVGCVSFLNSKPLIDGAAQALGCPVVFDVPSNLLDMLLSRRVSVALCPVIDYQLSAQPLKIVPVGGICCAGRTLTVRVFSRRPLSQVETVWADTDSHTSVNLMRVLFYRLHGLKPRVLPLPRPGETAAKVTPDCMLLIGDKVVTHEPSAAEYPHQMDLGEAWHGMTGLPFVFATWLALRETDLGPLPERLSKLREANAGRIEEIVRIYAQRHGWDAARAQDYLGRLLHYQIGSPELEAIRRFSREAFDLGLIPQLRPVP